MILMLRIYFYLDISPGTTRLDDVYSYKGKSYVYPIKHDLLPVILQGMVELMY